MKQWSLGYRRYVTTALNVIVSCCSLYSFYPKRQLPNRARLVLVCYGSKSSSVIFWPFEIVMISELIMKARPYRNNTEAWWPNNGRLVTYDSWPHWGRSTNWMLNDHHLLTVPLLQFQKRGNVKDFFLKNWTARYYIKGNVKCLFNYSVAGQRHHLFAEPWTWNAVRSNLPCQVKHVWLLLTMNHECKLSNTQRISSLPKP